MRPLEKYNQDLARPGFVADPVQMHTVQLLDALYDRLVRLPPAPQPRRGLTWLQGWLDRVAPAKAPAPERGLYLWGGVGGGKTYLVDTFFECLPFAQKQRMHFHRFMNRIHQELGQLKQQSDPLPLIADKLAAQTRLLCFDEFFVSDITDAMLLGTLLQALFERGVTLVATSNIPPDQLYRNGLQRARFVPAIEAITRHCDIVELDNGIDYRLRTLEQAELYHWPLDQQAERNLRSYFEQLAPPPQQQLGQIQIVGRSIPVLAQAEGVLLIGFATLCDGPRSQLDYMELARLYHTVLLVGVTRMGTTVATADDVARRFIALVDEFYERRVKLIIAAEVAMTELYPEGGRLEFEFRRCLSRLQEMQSHQYLGEEHRP